MFGIPKSVFEKLGWTSDDWRHAVEWRDEAIRRLEEILQITQDQLEMLIRRKSARDEECNRLRGEVDKLRAENKALDESIDGLVVWINEKDETILRQAKEIEELKSR